MRPAVRGALAARTMPILLHMMHGRAFPDLGASDFSETVSVATVADTLAPKPVTAITATAVAGGVRLDLTLPTQNTDGSAITDLKWLVVYYDPTDSIVVGSPATYVDPPFIIAATSQWTDRTAPEGVTRYYKVVARDDAGNDSEGSSEVSADALGQAAQDIPADATGLVFNGDPKVGAGMLGLLFEDADWAGFIEWEIQYALSTDSGSSFGAWTALAKTPKHCYIHKGLTTTATYRYKYRARPTGKSQASTTWDVTDDGGTGWPTSGTWASTSSAIVAVLVMAEIMVASEEIQTAHLKADCVTGAKILADEIVAGHITTNAITTIKINGAAVVEAKIGTNAVTETKIGADEVRTSEMYIDGTLIFYNDSVYHIISGCDYMTKDIAAHQWLDLGNGLWEVSATNFINLTSGANKDLLIYSGGDLRIDAEDDLIIQVNASDVLTITDIVDTDSVTLKIGHSGLITCDVGGATRYLAFREEA